MPLSLEDMPIELIVAILDAAVPKHVPEHNAGLEAHSGLVVTLSRTCKTLHVGLGPKINELREELWYHRNTKHFHRMAMKVMRGGNMEDYKFYVTNDPDSDDD